MNANARIDLQRPSTGGAQLLEERIIISREGERALRRELAELIEQRDVHLPRRLRGAREFGSGSENDDYLQIMEEEAVQAARIEGIERILVRASVIDSSHGEAGVVGVGSLVTLRISGKRMARQVRGAHEPLGSDGVSVASPIGSAILGRRAGERTAAELPNGRVVDVEIIAIEAPEPGSAIAA
jgi:transcription elongation factor GreA